MRTITALAIAALAEAATPYGIESFDSVLKPLWKGIRQHRGKVICHFLFMSMFPYFQRNRLKNYTFYLEERGKRQIIVLHFL